ncbi:N-acetylmuramic acid 6-phosphate etherase [Vallitalea pronyensis]|uniref:N-acetylmuramic acid 6-phosphate etherase n=1 Tax=Vallitalea pronyensis TaxID=1348613 RepID=A0A8J8SG82_9FIRM|nr:N-acetylmuramic acid 6-phosphate etherase [Vallitalea pronyensis]QUI22316.1 N-acetylmuramic acid 6-phosphate etherase [Vallitalea pronyensis]
MVKLSHIETEQKNERTKNIDLLTTKEVLQLMNDEDKKVAGAVEKELPHIAEAVEMIHEKIVSGGRLIYCGCGTSGRLGILDAVECPPTFGTDPQLIQGLIAGGKDAIIKAVEGAEDNFDLGAEDLRAIQLSHNDVLVGIAASGRTPYVLGAMTYANSIGAKTISLTCSPRTQLNTLADVAIVPLPGAEVITGSTRLKSGTAQKMVLNMLSTAVMIKLGKVYGNLMVDVKASNEKLVERTVSIVRSVTGVEDALARNTLEKCGYSAKTAIVMIMCHMVVDDAEKALMEADGHISRVIEASKAAHIE